MKQFIEICKIQFSLLLHSQNMGRSKKTKGLFIILMIAGIMVYLSGLYSFNIYFALPVGYKDLMVYLMTSSFFVMIFFFSITMAQGQLFGFSDFDMLMSWPIPKKTVFLAKVVSFVSMMLVYQIFLVLPMLVIYGMNQNVNFVFYILGFVGTFVLTLIPVSLASIVALIIRIVSGNGRFNKIILNVINVLIFVLIFVSSFMFNSGSTFLSPSMIAGMVDNIKLYLYPVYLLCHSILTLNFIEFALYLCICIGIFGLFIFFFNRIFLEINRNVKQGYKAKNFKLKQSNIKSPIMALFEKELKTVFSNFMYFFNLAIGQVLLVAGGIYLVLNKKMALEILKVFASDSSIMDSLFFMLCAALFLFALMTPTSCVSISLEGKRFWILKTVPVKIETVFLSKILVNAVIIWMPSLLGFLLITFAFELNFLYFLVGTLIIIVIGFWVGLYGLVINLNFPKLDFDREIVVIKQSMSSFISILGGILLGVGVFMLGVKLISTMNGFLVTVIFLIILLVTAMLFWAYLITIGKKKYQNLY